MLFTIYALLCSQQFTASSSCAGIARRTTHEAAAVGSSLQPWFDTWYTYRYIHTGTCLCHIIRYTVRGTVYPGTPYDDTDSKRMSYSVDTPRTRTSSPLARFPALHGNGTNANNRPSHERARTGLQNAVNYQVPGIWYLAPGRYTRQTSLLLLLLFAVGCVGIPYSYWYSCKIRVCRIMLYLGISDAAQ